MLENNFAVARFGVVSVYDAKRQMARVEFADLNNLVSDWLPVLVSFSLRDKIEPQISVGEHVLCVMLGGGIESGCVVGAIYDDKNLPLVGNEKIHAINFEDGASLSYDKENHELIASLPSGRAMVEAPEVFVKADKVFVNATSVAVDAPEIKLTGALSSGGGGVEMQGPVKIEQIMTSASDVIASGKSLVNHVHKCPACGAMTSAPC